MFPIPSSHLYVLGQYSATIISSTNTEDKILFIINLLMFINPHHSKLGGRSPWMYLHFLAATLNALPHLCLWSSERTHPQSSPVRVSFGLRWWGTQASCRVPCFLFQQPTTPTKTWLQNTYPLNKFRPPTLILWPRQPDQIRMHGKSWLPSLPWQPSGLLKKKNWIWFWR